MAIQNSKPTIGFKKSLYLWELWIQNFRDKCIKTKQTYKHCHNSWRVQHHCLTKKSIIC